MSQQREDCVSLAKVVALQAIYEFVTRHGSEFVLPTHQFLRSLGLAPKGEIPDRLKEYEKICSRDYVYNTSFCRWSHRIGQPRPVDLELVAHHSHEEKELFVVFDVQGGDICVDGQSIGVYARVECWCRLFQCAGKDDWHAHYVDVIFRALKPVKRSRFLVKQNSFQAEEVVVEEVYEASDMCLFFDSPQGGTWG